MVDLNRRMTHTTCNKGYFNKHPYDNKESRWCDLNEVPYARNGYLYGPETIEDQITGITYYQIDFYNNTNFYRSFYDGNLDPTTLFKEDDTLLVRHQQSDVRFKNSSLNSISNAEKCAVSVADSLFRPHPEPTRPRFARANICSSNRQSSFSYLQDS